MTFSRWTPTPHNQTIAKFYFLFTFARVNGDYNWQMNKLSTLSQNEIASNANCLKIRKLE